MVGQSVRITLDSFPGSLSWKGKVAEIDPAGTSIGGNVYYKTKIVFTEPDEQVKVGMTANVYIEIASREDALLVPISAVKTESGTRVVEVVRDGVAVSVPVTVGIESKGMVEIISGLTPGEQVALSLK
jgi:multidrug efflux pump subunit AcrA (membrane-fusion protein)